MKIERKGNDLIITIPFDETGKLSGSGKSFTHATTNGNVKTDFMVKGKPLTVGINAYSINPGYVPSKK